MTEDEFYAVMGEIALLQKRIDDLHAEMHCKMLEVAQATINFIRDNRWPQYNQRFREIMGTD